MARYEQALWKPFNGSWQEQPKMAKYDLIILHTMVGTLNGTDSFFRRNGYSGTFSHFGVGGDGAVIQWQDTAFRSAASGAANSRAISIEAADIGPEFPKWNTADGNAVPSWNPNQIRSLTSLIAWICKSHSIPCLIVEDSKSTRRGVAYHRLGVPGFAVPGGELWSSARGKVCPGQRRINQIPGIILGAKKILSGTNTPPNTGNSKEPQTGPTVSIKRRDNMTSIEKLEPTTDGSPKIESIVLPVGDGVVVTEKAWLSIITNGPIDSQVNVQFYNKNGAVLPGGTDPKGWDTIKATIPSQKWTREFPNGTDQVRIQYTNMPRGGKYTLETLAYK